MVDNRLALSTAITVSITVVVLGTAAVSSTAGTRTTLLSSLSTAGLALSRASTSTLAAVATGLHISQQSFGSISSSASTAAALAVITSLGCLKCLALSTTSTSLGYLKCLALSTASTSHGCLKCLALSTASTRAITVVVFGTAATSSTAGTSTTLLASFSAALLATRGASTRALAAGAASLYISQNSLSNVKGRGTTAAALAIIRCDQSVSKGSLWVTTASTAAITTPLGAAAGSATAATSAFFVGRSTAGLALDSTDTTSLAASAASLGITDSAILHIRCGSATAAALAFSDFRLAATKTEHASHHENTASTHDKKRPGVGEESKGVKSEQSHDDIKHAAETLTLGTALVPSVAAEHLQSHRRKRGHVSKRNTHFVFHLGFDLWVGINSLEDTQTEDEKTLAALEPAHDNHGEKRKEQNAVKPKKGHVKPHFLSLLLLKFVDFFQTSQSAVAAWLESVLFASLHQALVLAGANVMVFTEGNFLME